MNPITIPDRLVNRFREVVIPILNGNEPLIEGLRYLDYESLIGELVSCDERIVSRPHSYSPTAIKSVIVRLILEADFKAQVISTEFVRNVLLEILNEAAQKYEHWVVFVPFRAPKGGDGVAGSGRLYYGKASVGQFDINVIDTKDLLLSTVFDLDVDNSVRAPELSQYTGWWRTRQIWRGRPHFGISDSLHASYNRFASLACLWFENMFTPAAVFRYPVSLI